MSEIKSKLPHIGTSVFSVMSKMAAQYNAINLSQGFPNFPVAPELIENYQQVIKGDYNQYMPMPGAPRLLTEIGQKVEKHYGRKVNPETEILVTAGATQAIFTAIQAVIHPGDEAIVLDPSYDCYAPTVELAGGKPIHINMEPDFSVDWNKVEDAISKDTKLLIVNNPHNPGGTVFSEKDIQAIEQIMERHPHLYLLSDEVYEFIHFEEKHISINSRKAIRERAFITSSFGKTFHVTGWKIGYLVAPKALMDEVKKIHQYIVFSVNSTSQQTLANYLPQADLSDLGSFYQKKRDFFRELMKNSRFELLDCQGTYFQVARYSEISDKSDVDFATELTQKHGVAVIPVSGFNKDKHDDHLIRFCFAKDEDTIIKATEKLCKI
ncbi:methionine aminotransferase [Brumimicrobium salinarum]|uniref:Methionine aminotransferase n=1 Tax=Brumimicrobium salinarum TaxID=2058658 RepID=A0A2I0R6A1_9FLAO|nr:methionine aminotransferase [Brumimicrobium salinarum]PKR82113.1 methionine aminotransferase [Brumimicrobium salinarum]